MVIHLTAYLGPAPLLKDKITLGHGFFTAFAGVEGKPR
jgi:hypothetical protein